MVIFIQHFSLNENCFSSRTDNSISNLDYPSTKFQLNIKEAIKYKGISLNKMVRFHLK